MRVSSITDDAFSTTSVSPSMLADPALVSSEVIQAPIAIRSRLDRNTTARAP
jgi:hypothetical protein